MTDIRVATYNARKELGPIDADRGIAKVAVASDVVMFQEIESPGHKNAVRLLKGLGFTILWGGGSADACPIAYRTDLFTVRRKLRKRKTVEGEGGVTPDRWMLDVVLHHRESERNVPFLWTHYISQAWTAHPERRARWNKQNARASKRARNLSRYWGRCVFGADMNKSKAVPPGLAGHWADHGTYGQAYYDVLGTRGKVSMKRPRRIETPSDHDALVGFAIF